MEGEKEYFGENDEKTVKDSCLIELLSEGKIVYSTENISEITGLDNNQVIGNDIAEFLFKILDKKSCQHLLPLITEVMRKKRKLIDANVKAFHAQTEEEKLFNLQLHSSTNDFNRLTLVINDITPGNSKIFTEIDVDNLSILNQGNAFLVRFDNELRIRKILGTTEKITGIERLKLEQEPSLWFSCLIKEDREFLERAFKVLTKKPRKFEKEIRLKNTKNASIYWVNFQVTPIHEGNLHIGWEGIGFDITPKKDIELSLRKQSNRIDALFKITNHIFTEEDPAIIAFKSIKEIINATSADYGVVWSIDNTTGRLDIVTSYGIEYSIVEKWIAYTQYEKNIISEVFANSSTLNLKEESIPKELSFLDPGNKCFYIAPLFDKNKKPAGVILFGNCRSSYSIEDVELFNATISQLAFLIEQAEHNLAERSQADNLNLLYKLSHRLTNAMSPEEVADAAFPVLQEVLNAKRIWMGILNSSGSHIVGTSVYGKGVTPEMKNIKINLDYENVVINQLFKRRKFTFFDDFEKVQCKDIRRSLETLKPESLMLVPLQAIGQNIGLLTIEPRNKLTIRSFDSSLITSMANEVAGAILSRKFESQMAQSEKLKMADLLASGMAHNFNNLLQAIIGQAALLESKFKGEEDKQNYLKSIIDSANKGADLIKKMGKFSNPSQAVNQKLEVNSFFKDSKEILESLLGADASLEVEYAGNGMEIYADRSELQQILSILLLNAKEAMKSSEEKGKVSITFEQVKLENSEIEIGFIEGDYLRLRVSDNGIGMSPEQMERCFEPFYTTKSRDNTSGVSYKAAGLSLSMAYNMLKAAGGMIKVDSEINKGSTFSIFIPLAGEEEDLTVLEKESKLALYVSNEAIHPASEQLLNSYGYKFLPLTNKEEILQVIEKDSIVPNLLVLDLDNYNSGIIQLFKQLKNSISNISFIALSKHVKMWSTTLRFIEDLQLISKPLNIHELERSLKLINPKLKAKSLIEKVEIERMEQKNKIHISSNSKLKKILKNEK